MTIYVHIPNQSGTITTKGYHGWMQANGFSFSANREIQTREGNVFNRVRSHVLVNEIHIYKKMDQLSPFLFSEACTGKAISQVKIEVVTNSGTPLIQYTLENVIISEYDSFVIADDSPLEAIAFNFTHLEVRYFSHEKSGIQPISAKVQTGSQPCLNSKLKRAVSNRSEEGFKLFVATVYGEACGQSKIAWQAVASTIINRVNNKYFYVGAKPNFHRAKTTDEVIKQHLWYETYDKKRENFVAAYNFLQGKTHVKPKKLDELSDLIKPIYFQNQITTNAEHYYSPKSQKAGHQKHPDIYLSDTPDWVTIDLANGKLIEVAIPGLEHRDDFKFFKRIK